MMTTTEFPRNAPLKRCAIIGTAPTWVQAPWHDQTLEMWTLNDGYLLGLPRSDRHYEIHPLHQMVFKTRNQRITRPEEVPLGSYVRPPDHLDWLKSRPFPVYLAQARPDFPRAKAFPWDAVLQVFQPFWPWRLTRRGDVVPGKDYESSTPVWMLMHAIAEGYREIHVYGIHLATEWEYLQQRPNFEFVLGVAAGLGIKVVLPEATPICKGTFRYGVELKADIPVQEVSQAMAGIKHAGARVQQERARLKWYQRGRAKDLIARQTALEIELADAKARLGRLQIQARVA